MSPLDISINYLARALHVAPNRIGQIINGRLAITAATALRLSAFFGTTPEFWMNLQSLYELEVARAAEGDSIRREVRRMKPPAHIEPGDAVLS
jgi:addiction module HigA family antidote